MQAAIIYCRFSPRRNAELCESIEVQLEHCRRYCAQKGLAVVGEFSDAEASRNDADRPGLMDAIAALKRGMVLVVYRRDRLVAGELGAVISYEIRKRGAQIHAVDGSINDDTPLAGLVNAVLDAVAEFERQMIVARTRHAMRTHQRNGRAMGSVPPYGQMEGPPRVVRDRLGNEIVQRTWIENPEEAPVLRMILDRYRAGWNCSEIATNLNQQGIASRGRKWRRESIKRICERSGQA